MLSSSQMQERSTIHLSKVCVCGRGGEGGKEWGFNWEGLGLSYCSTNLSDTRGGTRDHEKNLSISGPSPLRIYLHLNLLDPLSLGQCISWILFPWGSSRGGTPPV